MYKCMDSLCRHLYKEGMALFTNVCVPISVLAGFNHNLCVLIETGKNAASDNYMYCTSLHIVPSSMPIGPSVHDLINVLFFLSSCSTGTSADACT